VRLRLENNATTSLTIHRIHPVLGGVLPAGLTEP
jgi:hypothetical protein